MTRASTPLRLLVAATAAAALSACAHEEAVTARDLSLLRDEVRMLRADRDADRRKLELLESHVAALAKRPSRPARAESAVAARGAVEIPGDLAVVKVAPRARPRVEDEEPIAFIVDRGGGDPRPRPVAAMGGPTGGPDVAPPLPTEVELKDPAPIPSGAPVLVAAATPPALEQGRAALAAGDAPGAIAILERFVKDAPRDPGADNALLALGDAFAAASKPGKALEAYQRVVTEFPAGDAVARALLRYGETCQGLGRKAAAKAAFERVVDDHAGTDAAEAARARLSGL